MNTWLQIWIIGTIVSFAWRLLGMLMAARLGKWEHRESLMATTRAVDALRLFADAVGGAMAWPVQAPLGGYRLWITLRSKGLQKLVDDFNNYEPLVTGTIELPPQDERSQEQLRTLEQNLRAELSSALGVSPLVKFYPLLTLSWEQINLAVQQDPTVFGEYDAQQMFGSMVAHTVLHRPDGAVAYIPGDSSPN